MGISVSLSAFNMKSAVLLSVLIAVAASEDNVVRKPKLFFVSTSATTSTLQTASICYLSFTTLTTCTGRKKRAIEMASDVASLELEPSQNRAMHLPLTTQGTEGSCSTGSPPPPSPLPPPSPPPSPSAQSSALTPELTSVVKPILARPYLLPISAMAAATCYLFSIIISF